MSGWIPQGLRQRYQRQRLFHHEYRSGREYRLLALLLLATILVAVPAYRSFTPVIRAQEAFEIIAGRKIQDLTFAVSKPAAAKFLDRWQRKPEILHSALAFVRNDNAFIFPYILTFWFFGSWACGLAYLWAPAGASTDLKLRLPLFYWVSSLELLHF
jgi:hypothetical protein